MAKPMNILSITETIASDMVWSARFGEGVCCPSCETDKKPWLFSRRDVFKCKACNRQFTLTSRTALASQKADNRTVVACAFAFCAAKKGISSLELSRMVGVQQTTAYHLMNKFREAIMRQYADVKLCGTVEIDGAFFGGHVRHQNTVENGRTRRTGKWHYGNRKVVTVLRQRLGKTLTFVGKRESEAKDFVQQRVSEGSVIVVDQAHAWDSLLELYDALRINHRWSFASNQTHTNNAESFFASLRRAQNGTYHQISGDNLHLYAQEMAWRLDNRKTPTEEMVTDLLRTLLTPVRDHKNVDKSLAHAQDSEHEALAI